MRERVARAEKLRVDRVCVDRVCIARVYRVCIARVCHSLTVPWDEKATMVNGYEMTGCVLTGYMC